MKKPKSVETQTCEPTVPITRAELRLLQDVADGLSLLKTIAHSIDSVPMIQAEWIILKIADPLWSLANDDLPSRWDEANPKAKFYENKDEN